MCGLLNFFVILLAVLTLKLATADVNSCYACAGPKDDCVENNRSDFLKMDCKTFTVEGVSLISRTAQPDILEKFDSEVGTVNSDSDIGCLTLTFNLTINNPIQRALKSCVPDNVFDEDICSYMGGLVSRIGGQKTSCHFCKKNDCNSAISSTEKSVILVIGSVYLLYYFLL